MTHSTNSDSLRRPRLLVRAARHGLTDYNRARDLRRLTGFAESANPERIAAQLMHMEDAMEQRRVAGDHTYEPARHIELLVALMAESKLSRAAAPETKARQLPIGWRVMNGRETRRTAT